LSSGSFFLVGCFATERMLGRRRATGACSEWILCRSCRGCGWMLCHFASLADALPPCGVVAPLKAFLLTVYHLCRFSSRVVGWVARLVVASLFLLLLLVVSFVTMCWLCSLFPCFSFSVFLCLLSLVLLVGHFSFSVFLCLLSLVLLVGQALLGGSKNRL
jgi:hypothetical protein